MLSLLLAMSPKPSAVSLFRLSKTRERVKGDSPYTVGVMWRNVSLSVLLTTVLASVLAAGQPGSRGEYVGGTEPQIKVKSSGVLQAIDDVYFVFVGRKVQVRVPYERINLLEYGQDVGQHFAAMMLVSPMFQLMKKRQHYLTIGFEDNEGRQQALVFRVSKDDIRIILVSLEAKTGQRVQYQDAEARKEGKG